MCPLATRVGRSGALGETRRRCRAARRGLRARRRQTTRAPLPLPRAASSLTTSRRATAVARPPSKSSQRISRNHSGHDPGAAHAAARRAATTARCAVWRCGHSVRVASQPSASPRAPLQAPHPRHSAGACAQAPEHTGASAGSPPVRHGGPLLWLLIAPHPQNSSLPPSEGRSPPSSPPAPPGGGGGPWVAPQNQQLFCRSPAPPSEELTPEKFRLVQIPPPAPRYMHPPPCARWPGALGS